MLRLFTIGKQLEYKGKWYNCEIAVVDRFFPSSKKCSDCGNVKKELSLAERTYDCDICGLSIDRDLNAAINLRDYTASSAEIKAFGDESSGSIRQLSNETIVDELGTKLEVVNKQTYSQCVFL